MDQDKVGYCSLNLIQLVQVRTQWQAVVNQVMNFWSLERPQNILSGLAAVNFVPHALCSMYIKMEANNALITHTITCHI